MRIGIDLGGTTVGVGLVDDNYRVISECEAVTAKLPDERALVAVVCGAVRSLIAQSGVSTKDISVMGIGVPGMTDIETGTAVRAGNIPVRNTCFSKILQDEFGIKTYLDNDANCAAWGEYMAGHGRGCKNLVMVTLGTGIGGGVVINGHILHGCENHAGELGHIVVDIHGKRCSCGRIGCWETLASTRALKARVAQEVANVPYGALAAVVDENGGEINGKTLFTALRRGDMVAKDLFDEYIELLSVGVMNILEAFRPELLVIGGGISKEGDTILLPLREAVGETPCRIEISALSDHAGIIGAALLDSER